MLSEFLQGIVDGGNIGKIFTHPHVVYVNRCVDFSKPPPTHDMQHNMFRVKLLNGFPSKNKGKNKGNVVCVFPNQNVVSSRILESRHYSNRDEFNKELNRRFSTSEEETEQFKNHRLLILYGSHCFVCGKISGTIYIVWAERVTRINASNTASIPYIDVPIIFNLDGLGSIKSMYLLRPKIENIPNNLVLFPKTQGNPVLMRDRGYNPWVCEKRPERYTERRIQTISNETAQALMCQNTQDVEEWLPFEQVPFSYNTQNSNDGVLEFEQNQTSWLESPRDIFGLESSSNLLIREEGKAQIMIHRKEPDPFEDTSADKEDESSFSNGVEIEL